MIEIITLVVAILIFIGMSILVFKSDQQFRDKSLDIKEGMKESQVMDIMRKDPISIDQLKDDKYVWTFENKKWKGWGTQITKIEVFFNESKQVASVERSVSYDRPGMKKE